MALLLVVAAWAPGVAAPTPTPPAGVLPPCSLAGYTFATFCQEHTTCGNATGRIAASDTSPDCGRADMVATGASAASAAFASPLFAVDPVAVYNVSWLVNTSYSVQKGGTVAGTVIAQFYDKHDMTFGPTRDADGWTPAINAACEKASTAGLFEARSFSFSAPTTAVAARLWLIFADGLLTHSTATGAVSVADVRIFRVPQPTSQQQQPISAPRFHVPDSIIQRGINMSTNCLRDSNLQGEFTVGSDYQTSNNISPDRGFGVFGVRRFGTPKQVAQYQSEWGYESAAVHGQPDGSVRSRTMTLLFWPLGVDQFFSYSGNLSYLQMALPQADLMLSWVRNHSDVDGLFECSHDGQPAGKVTCPGPLGMDWVDWHQSRALGKTFVFESWYVWTLQRMAALHEEFSTSFGNKTLALIYRSHAATVKKVLQSKYWRGDHWATNELSILRSCCDMGVGDCCQTLCGGGKCSADDVGSPGVWTDDQVWSLYFNISNDLQKSAAVWKYLESTPRDGLSVEGVPCRWTNMSNTGRLSWSWFGRLGAGDILARFKWGKVSSAYKLLTRVASVFSDLGNIYESYNMSGGRGGDTGGNYLEHCGGFAWAVVEGSFGIDFSSDAQAAATVAPRFDPSWPSASGEFRLRGVDVVLEYVRGSQDGVVLRRKQRQRQDLDLDPQAESLSSQPIKGGSNDHSGESGEDVSATVRVRLVWDGRVRIIEL